MTNPADDVKEGPKDDGAKLTKETLEDLDAPSDEARDVKGGQLTLQREDQVCEVGTG